MPLDFVIIALAYSSNISLTFMGRLQPFDSRASVSERAYLQQAPYKFPFANFVIPLLRILWCASRLLRQLIHHSCNIERNNAPKWTVINPRSSHQTAAVPANRQTNVQRNEFTRVTFSRSHR